MCCIHLIIILWAGGDGDANEYDNNIIRNGKIINYDIYTLSIVGDYTWRVRKMG